ncbi:MAG: ABC transporter substrate-binding protein [Desulfobulbaceae bacterium]|nr:ABC transporter substrate-binding protein [Desulfobulbaceae bacterium]
MVGTTLGFINGMEESGYRENDNIIYIKHETSDGIDDALAQMIDSKVDLIFTVTTPVTKKAKAATSTTKIPVVFALHDPVGSGVIKSLVHPASNLTGVQLRGSTAKSLEWLLAVDPKIKNIYVPVKFDTKAARQSLEDLQKVAGQVGVRLTVKEVKTEEELQGALAGMGKDVDAIFILHSILIFSNVDKIVEASIVAGVPVASGSNLYESGVTVTFGSHSEYSGKQVSRLAVRLLQGASAENIPTEVSEFFLGVNLKTAKQAGIQIPNEVLLQADFIVRE